MGSVVKVSFVQPLDPPDSHHLSAAEGWLGLGDWREANEELEKIAPALRAHPDVLEVRWHIYSHEKKWDMCVDIAGAIIKLEPNRVEAWIQRSFALHELKHSQEAFDQLLPVGDKFPKVWLIPYNLACYCAQLGRLEECREWFKKAMTIDEQTVRESAVDDPDLKPLWDSMSSTVWKKIE
jgi:tetratricopeptide (TPR) repeat protein